MTATATMIQVELWQLLAFGCGLLVSFLGCVFAAARWHFDAQESRLAERFSAATRASEASASSLHEHLTRHIQDEAKLLDRIPDIEREFLLLKADLPLHYVRREDYVRGQSVLESKLDALAIRIENVQLRKGAL